LKFNGCKGSKKIDMSNLKLFNHPEFGKIRTVVIDNEPWFCGKDVCGALGYERSHNAIRQHCREKGALKQGSPTNGGWQELIYINEGNLYRLILKSKLPAAEKFESWVCDEVLPSLRKTGFYSTGTAGEKPVRINHSRRETDADLEVMRMLRVIDKFLLAGDKKRTATKISVSQKTINDVIKGYSRSPRILAALYECAMENSRKLHGNLYLSPQRAIEQLINPKKKQ
jgi:prophage antirepressor-like protein